MSGGGGPFVLEALPESFDDEPARSVQPNGRWGSKRQPLDLHEVYGLLKDISDGQGRIEAALALLCSRPQGGRFSDEQGLQDKAAAASFDDASEAQWCSRSSPDQVRVHKSRRVDRNLSFMSAQSQESVGRRPSLIERALALQPRAPASDVHRILGARRLASFILDDVDDDVADWPWYILHPHSPKRLVIDALCAVVIVYDSIMVPLQLAWDIQFQGAVWMLGWLTCAFWATDMVLGFFCGYYRKGYLELEWRPIVRHYLLGAFVPNFLIVVIDVISLLLAHSDSQPPLGFRLLRLVRLPRSVMHFTILKKLAHSFVFALAPVELGVARYFDMGITLAKLLAFVLWCSHLLACLWQVVGSRAMGAYYDFIGRTGGLDDMLLSYLGAFYWTVNVMIAANSITNPLTVSEFIVTIGCLVFGLTWFSVSIGVIGDTMAAFRIQNEERQDQINMLRRYLTQSRIPTVLAVSIESQVHPKAQSSRVLEENVELLQCVPPQVSEVLDFLVWRPAIRSQVFVRACEGRSAVFIEHICAHAFERGVFSPGEFAFKLGERADAAFMVHWGTFDYDARALSVIAPDQPSVRMSDSRSNVNFGSHRHRVEQCRWVCELSLFCDWEHRGTMQASTQAELLKIRGDDFIFILRSDPELWLIAADYVEGLCAAVHQCPERWESDLALPVSHEEVLRYMNSENRAVMSRAGLAVLRKSKAMSLYWRLVPELADEVEAGTCDLVVRGQKRSWAERLEESVMRVVFKVALRLERSDGCVLAQVGVLSGEGVSPKLRLPGTKLQSEETFADARERVLNGPISQMKDMVTEGEVYMEGEIKPSASFQIPTEYTSQITNMSVDEDAFETRHDYFDLDVTLGHDENDEATPHYVFEAFVFDQNVRNSPPIFAWVQFEHMQDPKVYLAMERAWSAASVHVRQRIQACGDTSRHS